MSKNTIFGEEKECKCCHEWWYASDIKEDLCPNCYDYFKQLKQQLAEKQNTINEINKEFVQAIHDWKTLCAKKDNEIETMKKDSDKNIDYLVEFASLIENEKDCNRMLKALDRVKSGNKYIIDKANQSKTEFAIQELEKVKNKCNRMYELWLDSNYKENMYNNEDIAGVFEDISVFTNDLIKKLKGE